MLSRNRPIARLPDAGETWLVRHEEKDSLVIAMRVYRILSLNPALKRVLRL